MASGDTIRIRGGSVGWPLGYNDEGLVIDIPNITVTNWEDDLHRPWIFGSFSEDNSINPPSNFFDIISISASDVTVSNLVLIDAWFSGVAVRHEYGTTIPAWQMVKNITVENCLTYHTGSSGILMANAKNVVVRDNTVIQAVYRFGQECITLANVHNFDVDGNEVRDRPQLPGRRGGEGIDCKEGTRNGIIRNNRLVDVDRHAIYIDGYTVGCRNIDVVNNFVRNCGPGLSIAAERGGLVWDIYLHGNIIVDCKAGLYFGPHQEGWDHPVRYVRVAFNTFVGNEGGINIVNKDIRGLYINNNIVVDNISPWTGNLFTIRVAPDVDPVRIGLRVWNNVFESGTVVDDGNRTVDQSNQLYVQQFPVDDPKWDDPENYYPNDDSPALDNGSYTLIGDKVREDNVWKRFDISGYERRRPGYSPPGRKQDIGARERY